jgi:hypothetical protein
MKECPFDTFEAVDLLNDVSNMIEFCQSALRAPYLEEREKDGFYLTLECLNQKIASAKQIISDHLKAS